MEYKLNLLTPSLYSPEGKLNCVDSLVEEFACYIKNRAENEFRFQCQLNKVPGLAFIHDFEHFERIFLIHSEYAVIIASPASQRALNKFIPRLLVFLTSKPIWQNRFLFVCLGEVEVLSNLVVNEPIRFSLNDWTDGDENSWVTLIELLKITWEPHVEKPIIKSSNTSPNIKLLSSPNDKQKINDDNLTTLSMTDQYQGKVEQRKEEQGKEEGQKVEQGKEEKRKKEQNKEEQGKEEHLRNKVEVKESVTRSIQGSIVKIENYHFNRVEPVEMKITESKQCETDAVLSNLNDEGEISFNSDYYSSPQCIENNSNDYGTFDKSGTDSDNGSEGTFECQPELGQYQSVSVIEEYDSEENQGEFRNNIIPFSNVKETYDAAPPVHGNRNNYMINIYKENNVIQPTVDNNDNSQMIGEIRQHFENTSSKTDTISEDDLKEKVKRRTTSSMFLGHHQNKNDTIKASTDGESIYSDNETINSGEQSISFNENFALLQDVEYLKKTNFEANTNQNATAFHNEESQNKFQNRKGEQYENNLEKDNRVDQNMAMKSMEHVQRNVINKPLVTDSSISTDTRDAGCGDNNNTNNKVVNPDFTETVCADNNIKLYPESSGNQAISIDEDNIKINVIRHENTGNLASTNYPDATSGSHGNHEALNENNRKKEIETLDQRPIPLKQEIESNEILSGKLNKNKETDLKNVSSQEEQLSTSIDKAAVSASLNNDSGNITLDRHNNHDIVTLIPPNLDDIPNEDDQNIHDNFSFVKLDRNEEPNFKNLGSQEEHSASLLDGPTILIPTNNDNDKLKLDSHIDQDIIKLIPQNLDNIPKEDARNIHDKFSSVKLDRNEESDLKSVGGSHEGHLTSLLDGTIISTLTNNDDGNMTLAGHNYQDIIKRMPPNLDDIPNEDDQYILDKMLSPDGTLDKREINISNLESANKEIRGSIHEEDIIKSNISTSKEKGDEVKDENEKISCDSCKTSPNKNVHKFDDELEVMTNTNIALFNKNDEELIEIGVPVKAEEEQSEMDNLQIKVTDEILDEISCQENGTKLNTNDPGSNVTISTDPFLLSSSYKKELDPEDNLIQTELESTYLKLESDFMKNNDKELGDPIYREMMTSPSDHQLHSEELLKEDIESTNHEMYREDENKIHEKADGKVLPTNTDTHGISFATNQNISISNSLSTNNHLSDRSSIILDKEGNLIIDTNQDKQSEIDLVQKPHEVSFKTDLLSEDDLRGDDKSEEKSSMHLSQLGVCNEIIEDERDLTSKTQVSKELETQGEQEKRTDSIESIHSNEETHVTSQGNTIAQSSLPQDHNANESTRVNKDISISPKEVPYKIISDNDGNHKNIDTEPSHVEGTSNKNGSTLRDDLRQDNKVEPSTLLMSQLRDCDKIEVNEEKLTSGIGVSQDAAHQGDYKRTDDDNKKIHTDIDVTSQGISLGQYSLPHGSDVFETLDENKDVLISIKEDRVNLISNTDGNLNKVDTNNQPLENPSNNKDSNARVGIRMKVSLLNLTSEIRISKDTSYQGNPENNDDDNNNIHTNMKFDDDINATEQDISLGQYSLHFDDDGSSASDRDVLISSNVFSNKTMSDNDGDDKNIDTTEQNFEYTSNKNDSTHGDDLIQDNKVEISSMFSSQPRDSNKAEVSDEKLTPHISKDTSYQEQQEKRDDNNKSVHTNIKVEDSLALETCISKEISYLGDQDKTTDNNDENLNTNKEIDNVGSPDLDKDFSISSKEIQDKNISDNDVDHKNIGTAQQSFEATSKNKDSNLRVHLKQDDKVELSSMSSSQITNCDAVEVNEEEFTSEIDISQASTYQENQERTDDDNEKIYTDIKFDDDIKSTSPGISLGQYSLPHDSGIFGTLDENEDVLITPKENPDNMKSNTDENLNKVDRNNQNTFTSEYPTSKECIKMKEDMEDMTSGISTPKEKAYHKDKKINDGNIHSNISLDEHLTREMSASKKILYHDDQEIKTFKSNEDVHTNKEIVPISQDPPFGDYSLHIDDGVRESSDKDSNITISAKVVPNQIQTYNDSKIDKPHSKERNELYPDSSGLNEQGTCEVIDSTSSYEKERLDIISSKEIVESEINQSTNAYENDGINNKQIATRKTEFDTNVRNRNENILLDMVLSNDFVEITRQSVPDSAQPIDDIGAIKTNYTRINLRNIPSTFLAAFFSLRNKIWRKAAPEQVQSSLQSNSNLSIISRNSMSTYLSSPWCVFLMFVAGTMASPYWNEFSRRIYHNAIGPIIVIKTISSSIVLEDSINRRIAISSFET